MQFLLVGISHQRREATLYKTQRHLRVIDEGLSKMKQVVVWVLASGS